MPKKAFFLTNSALCSASEFGKVIVMITKSQAVILFQQQRYSNDEALADGVIEKHLDELPCNFLRFPGGTDSDGYRDALEQRVGHRRYAWWGMCF